MTAEGGVLVSRPPPDVPGKACRKPSLGQDNFVLQTTAMVWEILIFVMSEEGVRPPRYDWEPKDRRWQTLDDRRFQTAIEDVKSSIKTLLAEKGEEMKQLARTLDTSDSHFCSTYQAMARSTMGSEVRWGRIVALMSFTGIMAAQLEAEGQSEKVESLVGWERTFLCENCREWVQGSGGWESVSSALRNRSESDRLEVSTSSWWGIVLGTAGAVMGALLRC